MGTEACSEARTPHAARTCLVVEHGRLGRLVALAERLGLGELDMVRAARRLVHPPAADALGEHLVGHLERQHERHLVARRLEHGVKHLRLLNRAREAVKDEAARAVLVRDPILDDRDDQLVAHKPARRHHVLGLLAHLSKNSSQ